MRTGACLCGAVRFTARTGTSYGICHCGQCRRWTGGPLMAITVAEDAMTVTGEGIVSRRTSAWASRSHCGTCGSPLWYRWDKGVDGSGDYEVPLGLLDDTSGLVLTREIYADEAPAGIAYAGSHDRLDAAATRALFS